MLKRNLWHGVLAASLCVTCTPAWTTQSIAASNPVDELIARATASHVAENPQWQALIHASGGHARLSDPGFVLSHAAFSPQKELVATIKALYGPQPAISATNNETATAAPAVCRFPARYLWLQKTLGTPPLALDDCLALQRYLHGQRVSAVSLVYVGEDLTQPALLLGHVLLKLTLTPPPESLANDQSQPTMDALAVSFYTDAWTLNLPKLLAESMVTGKTGYFSILPYARKLNQYVNLEQRDVWEYPLSLNQAQMDLIQMHIFELSQTKITYLFHKYNCADIVEFILAAADVPVKPSQPWTTPRGAVKDVAASNTLNAPEHIAPSVHFLRSLDEQIPAPALDQLATALRAGMTTPQAIDVGDDALLAYTASRALNNVLLKTGQLTPELWRQNQQTLLAIGQENFAGSALAPDALHDPRNSLDEIQLGIGDQFERKQNYVTANFLPVSHTLLDDNRREQNENEVRLFDLGLRLRTTTPALFLDHLDILGIQSYIPHHVYTGGWSGRFRIGIAPEWTQNLTRTSALSIGGGLGITERLLPAVDTFLTAGATAGASTHQAFLLPELESGIVVREGSHAKTILSAERDFGQIDQIFHDTGFYTLKANQAIYLTRSFNIDLQAEQLANNRQRLNLVQLSAKWIF